MYESKLLFFFLCQLVIKNCLMWFKCELRKDHWQNYGGRRGVLDHLLTEDIIFHGLLTLPHVFLSMTRMQA